MQNLCCIHMTELSAASPLPLSVELVELSLTVSHALLCVGAECRKSSWNFCAKKALHVVRKEFRTVFSHYVKGIKAL